MSWMTRRMIHTHRSHGHGIAVMREVEQCSWSMEHVSSGQPVLEHIESHPEALL